MAGGIVPETRIEAATGSLVVPRFCGVHASLLPLNRAGPSPPCVSRARPRPIGYGLDLQSEAA